MKSVSIGSGGSRIPLIGYGTGTTWFKESEAVIDRSSVESFSTAIALGFYHLDAADMYKTERELGTAIHESKVPRASLFVTTKCATGDAASIPAALQASLQKLQLDYVDLYLIHTPFSYSKPEELQDAWAQMEKIHQQGLARNIGVSNFLKHHLQTILATATMAPAINQIELHPYLQRNELRTFMRDQGIGLAAFGTQTPLTNAYGKCTQLESYLEGLAAKYKLATGNTGQILVAWALQQGAVVITTGRTPERLKSTVSLGRDLEDSSSKTRWSLSAEEVEEVSKLGRMVNFRTFFADHVGVNNFE